MTPGARKHTVAGTIPVEWDAKLIKNCCDVVRGASPRPAGDPRYFDGDHIPWITVADVTGTPGMYLNGTRTKLTEEGANFTRLIPPATLIITNSGATLGVPKITRELSGANDGIAVFLNLKHVSKECLFYILESKTEYFRNDLAPGVGQPNLNTELLGDVAIPIPPPGEQDRIVDALSTWDTAIQKTEKLIAAKEGYYSHELSRLISRGQHPHAHVGTFAEEVSARNRGGKLALLGDFLTESREPDSNQDPARRLTVRLHLQGVEARPVRGPESDGATAYFCRRAGQLIYGKQNIFRGAIGIIPPELDGYASTQDLPTFDIADGIDPQWLYFWLSRKDFYTSLEALAAGSGSKRLHPEEFFKVHISVPDLATQTAIARYLNALREEIDLLGQSIAALKTQKRGLMQKLLTGQWRLPVTEAPSPPTLLPRTGEGSKGDGADMSFPLPLVGEGGRRPGEGKHD